MIVKQNYWDSSYQDYVFTPLPSSDPTIQLINRFVPEAKCQETAFEVGCFPGRFLVEIGKKGYILNGCDLTPRVEQDLGQWLKFEGCRIGRFQKIDFQKIDDDQKYNLVCSFGFIEHFENYLEVFKKQLGLVSPNGIVITQFPNFYGLIQRLLHYHLDKDNYNNHNIHAMDVENYRKYIPGEFKIRYIGYYGHFEFWNDDFNQSNRRFQKRMIKLLYKTKSIWKIIPNSKLWSPFGAIILNKIR